MSQDIVAWGVPDSRKAWCPLLDIIYAEDPTQNISSEDENSMFEKFF